MSSKLVRITESPSRGRRVTEALCPVESGWHDAGSRTSRVAWPAGLVALIVLVGGCNPDASSVETHDRTDRDAGACVGGTASVDGCVAWSTCGAGTYVVGAPSTTSDRTCAACPSGSFSTTINAAECTSWTTCSPGSHVSSVGSALADQQCAPCVAGTYASTANQAICVAAGGCPAGTEQAAAGTATSPPQCVKCEAGHHCAGGSTPKEACADGTWDHDSAPATACVAWTDCIAGQSVTLDGNGVTDRRCAACPSGSFSTTTNAEVCAAWTTCMPGSLVSTAGTASADRQCAACPAGQTSSSNNVEACVSAPAAGLRAGRHHTCARLSEGSVRCWGANEYGQLGVELDVRTNKLSPTIIPDLIDVVELAAGIEHMCARLTDGTVRCWGWNGNGQVGDPAAPGGALAPRLVPGLANVAGLAAGDRHTCAHLADGTVRCWGSNDMGQLGDGTTEERHSPVAVPDLQGVTKLVAGYGHTCARLGDGSVRCWGSNMFGELGDGTMIDSVAPVTVPGLTDVAGLASGVLHTCARLGDGSARCWGSNMTGALGDGTTTDSATPTLVSGLGNVAELSAGASHTCARLIDGSVRCWGANAHGQVGDGTPAPIVASPIAVPGLSTVAALATGQNHSCALVDDGAVRCWGANDAGQLGDGTTTSRLTPTPVAW